MVVPGPNRLQYPRQVSLVCHRFPRQLPLHRADKPFHAPVLPGTTWVRPLVADAERPQAYPKQPRDKDGLIVRSKEPWSAILRHAWASSWINLNDDLSESRCKRKQARLA